MAATTSLVIAGIELDPWGGATARSWNNYRQPHEYTTYDRGQTGDESLFRRYHGWFSRFDQPDPYDGSYSLTNLQSFNRYSYVQNDPVKFVDPTGLCMFVPLDMGESGTRWVPVLCNDNPFIPQPESPPSEGGGGGRQEPQNTQGPKDFSKIAAQLNFDFCVQQALRRYRKTYLKTSGKAVIGGVGIGLGAGVGIGIRGIGFGVRGAAHAAGDRALSVLGRVLTVYSELKDSAIIGTGLSFIGGGMAIDAIKEADQNSRRGQAAIEECKKFYPTANHSFSSFNF